MGLADSPLRDRAIFTFGVPRSGTYWLQRILVAHPEVAEVPSETSLFYTGIRPLLGLFHHGARASQAPGIYAERGELLDATREFCDRVLATSLRPDARYLAERTSMHVYCVPEIVAVYPDARLLHIIRDGRDVARSLVGREWGPSSVAEAAEEWRSGVAGARAARPDENYREVRYEALLADPEGEIADLYGSLGLPAEAGTMAAALAEAGRERNEDPSDPRIAAGKWRDEWGEDDVAAFMEVAGDLLVDLGYDAELAPRQSPGAGGDGRRRGDRLATLRSTVARRRRSDAPPRGADLVAAQRVVDGVLEAVHVADPEGLIEHLRPDVHVRIVTGADEQRLDGADALVNWLREHPVDAARQLRADPYPGVPCYSVVLSYELPDGQIEDRVLELAIRDEAVERFTLYRFPRPSGPRRASRRLTRRPCGRAPSGRRRPPRRRGTRIRALASARTMPPAGRRRSC